MTAAESDVRALRSVMYDTNLLWLFEQNRPIILRRLQEFAGVYALKVAGLTDREFPKDASLHELIADHTRNPYRLRTLLQALAFNCSAEILAMLWAVLLGAKLQKLVYEYERATVSSLRAVVRFSDGEEQTYVGEDHWDAAVLRLAALSKADGSPLIESFYPLHLPRQPRDSSRILQVLDWVHDFAGASAFCPSLIDGEHIQEIGDAIVDAVKRGLLAPEPGGELEAARVDERAEERARTRLSNDAAVSVALTQEGRRERRRARFHRQLRPASAATLTTVRSEILRVLNNSDGHTTTELEEIRDELAAIEDLLREAGVAI